MAVNVNDLPAEILSYVFSFIDGRHLSSVAKTCRLFYDAVQIESVWRKRCLEEFNIKEIDTDVVSYKEIYTKLLFHYGYALGLWRAKITDYGGLLHVKFAGNKIEATEYLAPPDPRIDDPLRARRLFTVEIDEHGNTVCKCHRGYQNPPHPATIKKIVMEKNDVLFKYECKTEAYHVHFSYPHDTRMLHLNEAVIEWLREETGNPNLTMADIHGHEMVLMKFIILLEFECNIQFVRLKLPELPAYEVPIEPGIFKGTYGQHGVELILLQYTDDKQVNGLKISGDPNVPAGQVTFKADLNRAMLLTKEQQSSVSLLQDIDTADLPPDVSMVNIPEQPFEVPHDCLERYKFTAKRCKYRCHSQGQIAGHNYSNPSFIPGHWIVFDENTFGHLWIDLHSLSIYSRVTEELAH